MSSATHSVLSPQSSALSAHSPLDRFLHFIDRWRWLFFGFLALWYLAGFNGQWNIYLDSAAFAELGRNVAEGKGYTYHGELQTSLDPGLPYLIALTFRLFGVDNLIPIHVVMLGFAGVALALTYALFCLHVDRPMAVLITFLTGVNERVYPYAFEMMTDMPFLVATLIFLIGYEMLWKSDEATGRRSDGGRGFAVAIAHLLIFLGMFAMASLRVVWNVVLGAAVLASLWHIIRGPRRLQHVFVCVVMISAVGAFKMIDPRNAGGRQSERREAQLLEAMTEQPFEMAERTLRVWVPRLTEETVVETIFAIRFGHYFSSVVSLIILALAIGLARRRMLWGMLVLAFTAQMLIFVPRSRYFLPILPLLIFAVVEAVILLSRRYRSVTAQGFAAVVLFLLIVPNMVKDLRFIVQQRRTPFLEQYRDGKFPDRIELAKKIEQHVGEEDVVITDYERVISYLSRRNVIAPSGNKRGIRTGWTEDDFLRLVQTYPQIYIATPLDPKKQPIIDRLNLELSEPIAEAGEFKLHRTTPRRPGGEQ